MKEIIQQTRIFLLLFICYIVILGLALIATDKGQVEIWINSFHTSYFDNFFYWVTYFGDGFFAAFIILGLILFHSIRKGLIITSILLLVSAVTQIFKLFVFPTISRPSVYLKDVIELHFVEGLEIHTSNSFPSGHTTQAFCMFFLFSFFFANRSSNYLFFVLALLAGISRIYLLQHFLIDIYFGAIIGTAGSLILLYVENTYHVFSNPALNKPLINIR